MADLEDRNVVLVVILGQQGDLWPLPERLLGVVDCKVSGVKLEQSEHFYLYLKRIPEYKHVDLIQTTRVSYGIQVIHHKAQGIR